MASSPRKPNVFWGFFRSVRLTIVLLIFLAGVSIVGTLVPQGARSSEFAHRLSPTMHRVFHALDLFDMFYAPWFRVLIACLALNIIVCSIDRFQATWKRAMSTPRPDRQKPFEDIPPEQTFSVTASLDNVQGPIGDLVRSRYKRFQKAPLEGQCSFYGDRGRYAHFGVYLVHLSILLIIAGALLGSFFGFQAYVNIVEGDSVHAVSLRKERKRLVLPFEIRCDRFFVEFYDTGAPKEYRSDLTFLIDGEEVEKHSILVNHPVEFGGVTFYQSSYGTVPSRTIHLELALAGPEAEILPMVVDMDKPVPLPGGEGTFAIVDARTDIAGIGKAALIVVTPKEEDPKEFWIFEDPERAFMILPAPMLRSARFNPSAFKPYTFHLKRLDTLYYTGLQVNRDPGTPVVWAGFFAMTLGLIITFFTSHRRVWVRVRQKGNQVTVETAGTTSKNPVGLDRELARLTSDLKKILVA